MATAAEIGAAGERAAIKYLRSNGFLIVERNWRAGRYELDIIAQKWDTIHIVEVKTRSTESWTAPEDAMTRDKITALKRAITAYMRYRPSNYEYQFDLIAIDMSGDQIVDLRHIERIF